MKKMMLVVISAVLVFGTITMGFAEQGDWHGGIRSRIEVAKQKIDQGIERGTLDRREADRLHAELGAILNKIDRMKTDGSLSQWERDHIKNDLDRLERNIFNEKHDAQAAAPTWRGGIRSRIENSKQKIAQGVEQGTLNRSEARRLNKELGRILNKIDRMKSDGSLSKRERNRVKRDLDRLDREIFKEKHDNNRRY